MMISSRILKRAVILFCIASGVCYSTQYYGSPIGSFKPISNDIQGEVFIVDENTLFIKGFSYDGYSEDAVFWAGFSDFPDNNGFIIPADGLSLESLEAYNNHDLILHLPEKKRVTDIRWLSIWNRNSSKNLASLILPDRILIPHPMAIGPLINTKNDASTGDILILDTQTFLIPDFTYDDSHKETYWWISKGTKPSEIGIRLQENGSDAPLKRSANNTVVVILPKGHSVLEYDTLSIWNINDGEHYGFVDIPKSLNIPPSLRISEKEEFEMDEFNCEMLNDNLGLEVRWMIKRNDIILHLMGNIGPSEYMSLGFSKDDTETKFDSADAVVAGIDSNGKAHVVDYFFQNNEKCENGNGMCPDNIFGSTDDLNLLEVRKRENSTTIIFKRNLQAEDKVYDQNIYTDGPQAILWAVGRLGPDGFAETPRVKSRGNLLLDFGREPNWNCPSPKENLHPTQVKEKTHRIHCPSDRTFRAQIGSSPRSNVKKVWFINGLPTPQINVQRGNTYTFIVEGGLSQPFHHPFYITNSKKGGMYQNILEAIDPEEYAFAGVEQDAVTGNIYPTAEGRLCMWTYSDMDSDYSIVTSNQDVKSTLSLKCEPGEPGKLMWTPDNNTPDVVYYQSFRERNLGGEIKVLDFCEETNPHGYLEITTKGGKPKRNRESEGLELDREVENEFVLYSALKREENLNTGDTGEHGPKEFTYSNKQAGNDKHTLSNNIAKFVKRKDETSNAANINDATVNVTSFPHRQESENAYSETLFPHDESERSDTYLSNHGLLKQNILNKHLNLNTNTDDLPEKRPIHSVVTSNIPSRMPQSLNEFKPQFEGGFLPLVMNPMKDKEFSQTKEFTYVHQQRSRPHRPFLYNESVPFHGTFKPGVPDFSGFNISHYSQEDASIITGNNRDELSILSASKPQLIREPFPPVGAIPLHLLQHPNIPPNRIQEIYHRHRQQNLPFGMRQNAFPPLEFGRKPNNPIPNIRDEDLAGVSSQHIYTSLQASGDKKPRPGNIHNQQHGGVDRKPQTHQNLQMNKIIYPPPIQRRPDLYETRDVKFQQSNVPRLRYNAQQSLSNSRQNPQNMNFPVPQTAVLQRHVNNIHQIQSSSLTHNRHLPLNRQNNAMAAEQLRHPYPLQVPLRDRIPNIPPLAPNRAATRLFPLSNEEMNVGNAFLNRPHIAEERLHIPPQIMNVKSKIPEKLNIMKSEETDSLPSPSENNASRFAQNSEFDELRQKQAYMNENPIIHPDLRAHNAHSKETLNASTFDKTNTENVHISTIIESSFDQKDIPLASLTYPPEVHDVGSIENISTEEDTSNSKIQTYFTNAITPPPQIEIVSSISSEISINGEQTKLENVAPLKNDNHSDGTEYYGKVSFEVADPDILASKPVKIDATSVLQSYERESLESENNTDVKTADYLDYSLPYGARLKLDNSQVFSKSSNENHRIPGVVFRKSHIHSENGKNIPSLTKLAQLTTSASTEASVEYTSSLNWYERKENSPKTEAGVTKNLYYPSFATDSALSKRNETTNINAHSTSSDEVKHIPIIADTLEEFIEATYIGRKNILPDNSNSSLPSVILPPKLSEDINLPEISEKLPLNDNKTNYSILDHVLSLIGNPPDSKETH